MRARYDAGLSATIPLAYQPACRGFFPFSAGILSPKCNHLFGKCSRERPFQRTRHRIGDWTAGALCEGILHGLTNKPAFFLGGIDVNTLLDSRTGPRNQ